MKKFVNLEKEQCFGCKACSNICPTNAITFQHDDFGFSYPHVNKSLCINCGKCLSACNKIERHDKTMPLKSFAATHKDRDILNKSSSGGVFSVLAEYVLQNNGAVCGCVYDENLLPKHICSESAEDVALMRKSKYAQSDIGTVYQDAKNRLKKGQQVLFTGTPCQIAALYSVLDKDYNNLITMDLVCHGTVSELMFKKFLEYLESKYKTNITDFDFRSKKYGWKRYTMEFSKQSGQRKNIGKYNEFYFNAFISGNITRPNCFSCPFASPMRISDITVGDFWGFEKASTRCDAERGISLCTLNSEKALGLLPMLESSLTLDEIDYRIAVDGNTCLHTPTKKGSKWEEYMHAFKNDDIQAMANSYAKRNRKRIFKEKLKLMIPLKAFLFLKRKRTLSVRKK